MSHFFTHIAICFLSLVFFLSCSKERNEATESFSYASDFFTRSDFSLSKADLLKIPKEKMITREIIPLIIERNLDKSEFKNIDKYDLTTVSKDDRELMHVANFDGGGWAIISGCFKEGDLILAQSTEGQFDPENIESPEVRFWFEKALSMVEGEINSDDEKVSEITLRSVPQGDYLWIRIPTEDVVTSSLYYQVSPLTNTQWGQRSPWNSYCPIPPGTSTRCPFGCTAVAYAQMLYYLHRELGVPDGLYHQIDTSYTWNSTGEYYTSNITKSDYNNPSPRWTTMQKYPSSNVTQYSLYTGNFILDIADRLGTKFSASGSEADFLTDIFDSLGVNCTLSNTICDNTIITNSLDESMPVLVSAYDSGQSVGTRSSTDNGGHAWIIDGYKITQHTTDHQSYLRRIPSDSLMFFNYLIIDQIYTDSRKESLFPDVGEYEIIHDYSYSYTTKFRMNWGWNGLHNGYYSSDPLYWNPNSNLFNDRIKMIYGFSL